MHLILAGRGGQALGGCGRVGEYHKDLTIAFRLRYSKLRKERLWESN